MYVFNINICVYIYVYIYMYIYMGPMALSENRLPQIAIVSVVDHPFPNGNGEPGHSPFQRPSPRCCPP